MKKIILALSSLILVLGACAPAAGIQNSVAPASPPIAAPAQDSAAQSKGMVDAESAPAAPLPGSTGGSSAPDQLVIQNANLAIVVKDPAKTQEDIIALTKAAGGYLVSSNTYKSRSEAGIEYPEVNISMRVPAEKLDDTLNRIKAFVEDPEADILSENRSGQNVTKEYTDLKSRLTNLEQAEAQLRKIMDSAVRTEDVLAVFNQLTQIREQIEVIKGQMKYYEESAAMSAVDINIKSQESIAPLTVGGWHPEGVARDALQFLIDVLKFLVNVLIYLVISVAPLALLIGVPIWLIVRASRRARAKRKEAGNPPAVKL